MCKIATVSEKRFIVTSCTDSRSFSSTSLPADTTFSAVLLTTDLFGDEKFISPHRHQVSVVFLVDAGEYCMRHFI